MLKRNKIIILILILLLAGCRKKIIPQEQYSLTIRLQPNQEVNYTLEINNTFLKTGSLETSWNDIKVKNQDGTFRIYFWDSEHYKDYIEFINYDSQRNITITKEIKLRESNKKGSLEVYLSQKLLKNSEQNMFLRFNTNGTVKKISYCIYRTVGIISTDIQDIAVCSQVWTNETQYGNLTNNRYLCDKVITGCKSVNGINCYSKKVLFPEAEKDECFFLGKTLSNEEYSVRLKTNTMHYFDEYDYLLVTVFDMDLKKNSRIFGKEQGYGWNEKVFVGELR